MQYRSLCVASLTAWVALFQGVSAHPVVEQRANAKSNALTPIEFGLLLYPAFQAIDVFGPMDFLNMLSLKHHINLHIIAETADPVSTQARAAAMNPFNSSFAESVVPTHTFRNAPKLDVLFIPGGIGSRAPNVNATVDFVPATYPSLQYLISACTGGTVAARAGVLDGRRATTNKKSWSTVVAWGMKTYWVAHARWVVDGNVWTTSGLAAAMDGTLAWIAHVFGEGEAFDLALGTEYEWHRKPRGTILAPTTT